MIAFLYGVVVYVLFLGVFIYAIGFVGNIGVPKGLDSPATGSPGYILVGIWFEERDLIAHYGARYLSYKQQVGMLFPRLTRSKDAGIAEKQ